MFRLVCKFEDKSEEKSEDMSEDKSEDMSGAKNQEFVLEYLHVIDQKLFFQPKNIFSIVALWSTKLKLQFKQKDGKLNGPF